MKPVRLILSALLVMSCKQQHITMNLYYTGENGSARKFCVAGRGWYQEWGKEAVPMTPGTIIAVPAEVKHWHGAAADSWFQHITYHKDVQEGASNEWLEPVTDSIYNSL